MHQKSDIMRTRIKICGFTRAEDAVFASHLGVDAIGLVFYPPSPRNVQLAQAREIVQALPAFISIVALFVDEHESRIREVLEAVPIDIIQFHGDENPEACRIYNKPYIKALRMQQDIDIANCASTYHDAAGLLLDAYHPNTKGGTGDQFDWTMIPEHCAFPLILAGGLDADNAKQAVQSVKPYALDVSTGVEVQKGIKDTVKMTAFVEQVYQADRSK
jgi:phosphoribosylanthranilate isomerase